MRSLMAAMAIAAMTVAGPAGAVVVPTAVGDGGFLKSIGGGVDIIPRDFSLPPLAFGTFTLDGHSYGKGVSYANFLRLRVHGQPGDLRRVTNTSLMGDIFRSGLIGFALFRRDGSEIVNPNLTPFALDGEPIFVRAIGRSDFGGEFAYSAGFTVTPLPPAAALLAAPLLGLGWLSRRRRRQGAGV